MANSLGGPIHIIDIAVIVVYFVLVFVIGIVSSCRMKRNSLAGYFLAGREVNCLLVGASLFASNIGSMHFVGLAGSGAASGIAVANFEILAVFAILILGWFFVPVYTSARVYTMPEYLQKRFNSRRIQMYLSVLALLLYVFTKISTDLFAGSIFIQQAMGWDVYSSIILLLVIAAIFSITGGLTAVIWTDFLQTGLMVVGAFVLMILSFKEVGGYSNVMAKFLNSHANTSHRVNTTQPICANIPGDSLHLFRSATKSEFPWTGMTFGLFVIGTWYWCSDQVIVQRTLAAKSLSHVKGGCIMAGYLKLLPMFLIVFPGMISRILFPDEVGCADAQTCREVCGNEGGCTNIAYPLLVIRTMPVGLTGVMLAVMMAALMSSLTSIFNSSSTIFTMDIYKQLRKTASEAELLIAGRVFIGFLVVISIAWIPVFEMPLGSQLFIYTNSICSYLAPPICAVYVLAIFWKRTNEFGAFWGLMMGLVIGMTRFIFEFTFPIPPCGSLKEDTRMGFIKMLVDDIHFLHFGAILFVICLLNVVGLSLCTEQMDEARLIRLTYWTRYRAKIDQTSQLVTINITSLSPVINTDVKTDNHAFSTINNGKSQIVFPLWRKIVNFICGISSAKPSAEQCHSVQRRMSLIDDEDSLAEQPFCKSVCNANAAILIGFVFAILVYFA